MKIQNDTQLNLDNKKSFAYRLYVYQRERFPLIGNGLLISSFTFSAISYSRICRGEYTFVPTLHFLVAIFTAITLFILVRIADEFKDKDEDALHRSHLPVPRGLVTLKELKLIGLIIIPIQLCINMFFSTSVTSVFIGVLVYLGLMTKEFFIASWLKINQLWYVVSHMMIIPLIDIYASSFDWLINGAKAPFGLLFFFFVSFMNGIVLEIGRKIRVVEKEEFNSYSSKLGFKKATLLWIVMLFCTLLFSVLCCWYAGYGKNGFFTLSVCFIICVSPAILFLKVQKHVYSKAIEYASAVWTISMYLCLGGIPMLVNIL